MIVNLKSSSKVNLFLDVIQKRRDGYHEIQSLFMETSLGDDIRIESGGEDRNISIKSNYKDIENENNIIYGLWKILLRKYKKKIYGGVDVYIKKHVPLGSGLGGGSGDAFAVLDALDKYFNLDLNEKEMLSICKKLGADVPFFINGGLQKAFGKGDRLIKLKDRMSEGSEYSGKMKLIIVCPKFSISTQDSYKALGISNIGTKEAKEKQEINHSRIDDLLMGLLTFNKEKIKDNLYNRFEKYAFDKYPELEDIKNDFQKQGAVASLMSGSGSAVFGIFEDNNDLSKVSEYFQKKYPHVFIAEPKVDL